MSNDSSMPFKSHHYNLESRSGSKAPLCWECGTRLMSDNDCLEIELDGYPRKLHRVCYFNIIMSNLNDYEISSENEKKGLLPKN